MYIIIETLILLATLSKALADGLTFELPDNQKQCFHEIIDKGEECTLEFQVVTGGNYDVDMELTDPMGKFLYKEQKKQYESFTFTTEMKGEYKFCFSNEFSTFTHKVVYFDLLVGDEDTPFFGEEDGEVKEEHHKAMTQMETSAVTIHESVKIVLDYQTHHKLREAKGRSFAEDLNERVMYWSIGEFMIIILIGFGQVVVLRSFFSDKKRPTRT